jgi:hypothetical protein
MAMAGDSGIRQRHLYSVVRLTVSLGGPSGDTKGVGGTGFFVAANDKDVVLVTNRHVVSPGTYKAGWHGYTALGIEAAGHHIDATGTRVAFVLRWSLDEVPLFFPDNLAEDAAVIPLVNAQLEGLPSLVIHFRRNILATIQEFGDDVSPGDSVVMPGYPRLGGQQVDAPVLMPGVISSDPAYPMATSPGPGRLFLVHAFSRQGLSGAPVYAVQRGLKLGEGLQGPAHRPARIAGINAGHLPADGDGPASFSYAVRSDVLVELIDRWLAALSKARAQHG